MTSVYFVRHAQPDHDWEDDRTRPLSDEGLRDSKKVTEALRNIKIDCFLSSPYQRSFNTIKESAIVHNLEIHTDERFRERKNGSGGNVYGMFQKRWSDFDFHEEGGESLRMVQKRNVDALMEVLNKFHGKSIVIGTHGTALSTILNYFKPSFCCDDFLRIIDYMPYIIRLDFEGVNLAGKEEVLIVEKEFNGKKRADKNNADNALTHIGMQQIETQRLILRKFEHKDNEDMLKYWAGDPYVQAMYSEPVYKTTQEVTGLLDKYIGSYNKDDYYRWAVILKETNECIGQIAFFLVDSKNHFAEIEYCIGSLFQKRGLATEATRALIEFGFEKIKLHKIQVCHKSINIPSRRVIEKCGFVYEGTLRDYFYMDGQYVDRLYYSILRDEYLKGKEKNV